jgi:choline-glycine betaine transporter
MVELQHCHFSVVLGADKGSVLSEWNMRIALLFLGIVVCIRTIFIFKSFVQNTGAIFKYSEVGT